MPGEPVGPEMALHEKFVVGEPIQPFARFPVAPEVLLSKLKGWLNAVKVAAMHTKVVAI